MTDFTMLFHYIIIFSALIINALGALSECFPGWHMTDTCIRVIRGRRRTFDGASSYCQKIGGDLATSITTRSQRSFVMDQVKFRAHLWIGVHSPDKDGTFHYIMGVNEGPVEDNAPFKKGRPYADSNNYCVTLKGKRWYDKDCRRRFFFVCEMPLAISL